MKKIIIAALTLAAIVMGPNASAEAAKKHIYSSKTPVAYKAAKQTVKGKRDYGYDYTSVSIVNYLDEPIHFDVIGEDFSGDIWPNEEMYIVCESDWGYCPSGFLVELSYYYDGAYIDTMWLDHGDRWTIEEDPYWVSSAKRSMDTSKHKPLKSTVTHHK